MIKVSVIVPVFNVESYINRCVNSLLNQTYKDIEIILVDDGSSDKSWEICEEYSKIDNRIKVLRKTKNSGVSVARNDGLMCATGKYVTFVDSDDYVENKYIENLVQTLIDSGSDMAISSYYLDYGNTVEQNICEVRKEFDSHEAILNMLLAKDFDSCVCCKISLLQNAKEVLFDENLVLAEDMLFYYRNLEKCRKIAFVNSKYYHYVQHENGTMSSLTKTKINSLYVFEKLINEQKNNEIKEALISKYLSTCFHLLSLKRECVDDEDVKKLKSQIKKYRSKAVIGQNIALKVRVASAMSFLGFKFIIYLLNKKQRGDSYGKSIVKR